MQVLEGLLNIIHNFIYNNLFKYCIYPYVTFDIYDLFINIL